MKAASDRIGILTKEGIRLSRVVDQGGPDASIVPPTSFARPALASINVGAPLTDRLLPDTVGIETEKGSIAGRTRRRGDNVSAYRIGQRRPGGACLIGR